MDRVRLGIVGCGNIGQRNAPGYLEHPLAIHDAARTRRPVAPETMR